jgi:hypothetical protein
MDERAGILNSNKAARSDAASVPSAVAWLGGLGIVPFAGLSLATPFASDVLRTQLSFALLAYGAIILSFLGGIHWGLAIGAVPQSDNMLWPRIALSILPSLVAWAALLAPFSIGSWPSLKHSSRCCWSTSEPRACTKLRLGIRSSDGRCHAAQSPHFFWERFRDAAGPTGRSGGGLNS